MTGWVLGAIYSVPPLRTKQNPILAGLTIATVRGFLLNFGVYYAVKNAIGSSFSWSPKVSFIARFMTIFATVIAVTKDLPDIDGDKVSSGSIVALTVFAAIQYSHDDDDYTAPTNEIALLGQSNRNVCYQNWRHSGGHWCYLLSHVELCPCHPNGSLVQPRCLPSSANDWWSFGASSDSNGSVYPAETGIHGVHQGVLQANLGSLLSGVCPLHSHLIKATPSM